MSLSLSRPDLLRTQAFIDGRWCDADGGGTCAVHNPASSALLGSVPDMGAAETTRAIAAAGLHPSIGVHHRNRYNPLCLADDVMEPFRPMVDLTVFRLVADGRESVDPSTKRALALVGALDMRSRDGTTPLASAVQRLATSLAQSFETGEPALDLPLPSPPLELAAPGGPGAD